MGYTHYWRNVPKLSAACVAELKELLGHAFTSGLIWRECEDSLPPIVSPKLVRFNGVGHDSYETFLLSEGSAFAFCKTGHRPYDKVVVASLKVVEKHHAKDGFTWSSDGSEAGGDFKEADELLYSLRIPM